MNKEEFFNYLQSTIYYLWPIISGFISGMIMFFAQRSYRQDDLEEIEKIKSSLSKDRDFFIMQMKIFSETRFKIFNELWINLTELEYQVSNLWNEGVSANKIKKLSKAVYQTEKKIKESVLVIDNDHIRRLNELIETLKNYQISKKRLLDIDDVDEYTSNEIQNLIHRNFSLYQQYKDLKGEVLISMKAKLGIE